MDICSGEGLITAFVRYGKYGQLAIVLPDKDAVIAINAESRDAGSMTKRCMDVIVPQL